MNKLQTFLQEEILKRLYLDKSLDEIKEIERDMYGCLVEVTTSRGTQYMDTIVASEKGVVYQTKKDKFGLNEMYEGWKIIGLPPTLPRVLTALGDNYTYMFHGIFQLDEYDNDIGTQYEIGDRLCEWDLSKDNLFDQSEETQKAIAKLLGYTL